MNALMKAMWTEGNEEFNSLPSEIIKECKEICRVYDRAFVTYEYGEYKTSACISLRSSYPADHRAVGCYFAEDMFTPDERIINYIEVFRDYPIEYKGKRDYIWLKDCFSNNRNARFELVNGNIVLKEE